MVAAIIVLATILILGSMLWVLPSPKERQQMQLRQLAMSKGLNVQLTQIKDMASPGQMLNCVAYRLPRLSDNYQNPSWKLFRTTEEWRMDIKGWTFDRTIKKEVFPELEVISNCMAQLPENCVAAESNKYAVGIYWRERGDEKAVADIENVLKKLLTL